MFQPHFHDPQSHDAQVRTALFADAPDAPAGCAGPGAAGGRMRGWQRWVFPGIWLVYLTRTATGVATYSAGWPAILGYAIIVAFAALYLYIVRFLAYGDLRTFLPLFAIACALTAAELVFAHETAFVMTVFLTVLLIGTGRRWASAVIAAILIAVLALPPLIPSWHAGPDVADAAALVMVTLAMSGFFAILRTNRALAEARSEVARLAAENERSRIARDLHDLLGHSLTTITVKAGLARRLADVDPARAAVEIREVEELTRSALADVRAAVSGYRELSLAGELATGREALRSAAIEARLPGAVDAVAPQWQELFGWVVREGLTNAIRHSRAQTVTIELGRAWIEVRDDGHGGPAESLGTGLAGLRERVESLGGTFESGPASGITRGWRLRAQMPADSPARDAPASDPPLPSGPPPAAPPLPAEPPRAAPPGSPALRR